MVPHQHCHRGQELWCDAGGSIPLSVLCLSCLERLCSHQRKSIPVGMEAQIQTEILRLAVFTAVQSLHTECDSLESVLHALARRVTNSELS